MILSCGTREIPAVTLILGAQETLRIRRALSLSRRGDIARILLGLAQIDRYIEFAVFRLCEPFLILGYPVRTDIIRGFGERIIVVGRLF